jgi:hypothetical protein
MTMALLNLHRCGRNGRDFPVRQLNEAISKRNRSATFTPEALTRLFDREYGEPETFLALTLLYDDMWWGSVPHHVDHIFPQKSFSGANLRRAGVPDADHDEFSNLCNRLANLELLTNNENVRKNGQDFSKWIRTRSRTFANRHRIPGNRRLYSLLRFPTFLRRREALIRSRLLTLFSA